MESTDVIVENKKRIAAAAVDQSNFEILPIVYEIIRSIEKDHHDNSAKTRESQDCSQKVLELQKRLDQARDQINLLPGIEFSKDQQLSHLDALKTQLQLKQELLHKYHYIGKGLIEDTSLKHKLTPEEFRILVRKFSQALQQSPKQIRQQFKKRN